MKSIYILLFVLMASSVNGQTTFNKRLHFGFPAAVLTGIVPTDSCYYSIGILADSLPPYATGNVFTKLDLEGEALFVKTITGGSKTIEVWNQTLLPNGSSGFAAAGYSVDSIQQAILIFYSVEGDTISTSEYLNPNYPEDIFIQPESLLGLPGGGFVFSAWIENAPIWNTDQYLVRVDAGGGVVWAKTYGDNFWDLPGSLILGSTGDILAGGRRTNINQVQENFTSQVSIVKLDQDGSLLFEYLTPTSLGLYDGANDMVLLEDGSLVVATGKGTEIERPTGNTIYFDKHVFKLSPDFDIAWEVTFEDEEPNVSSRLTNIVEMSDGSGFVAAGSEGEDTPGTGTYAVRGWLAKISQEGEPIWTRKYVGIEGTNPRHTIYDLKETPDGGLILCGESRDGTGDTTPSQQGWLLKLDGHGCLVPGCHLTDATDETALPEIELAIYPNPTADYLNFQLRGGNANKNAAFRITDAQGRTVREFESASAGATLIVPVWEWGAGIYFLQYVVEGEVLVSEKFVVAK